MSKQYKSYKDLLDFDSNDLIVRLYQKEIKDADNVLLDCIFIILNFTNQDKVPWHLERTLYSMCVDYDTMYKKALQTDGNIKSITRGDFKTEFKDESELKKYIETQLTQNYASSLVEFRKLRN